MQKIIDFPCSYDNAAGSWEFLQEKKDILFPQVYQDAR